MKQYTLTISPKYAAHWGLWEAVRELLQNAYDQRDREPGTDVEFFLEEGTLFVKTSTGHLDAKSLLLGETDKEGEGLRGKFGEGYKLALLVLVRLGHKVRVLMDNEEWEPVIEHDENFGCEVLKIKVDLVENMYYGVNFRIDGVTQEQFDDLKKNVIDTILCGVLGNVDKDETGRIYVGGLYVTTLKDMKHGYAFRPGELPLDRDRGMVDGFNVKYATSRIWADRDDARAAELVSSRAPDVEYVTSHVGTQSRIIAAIERTVPPDVVPVTNQEEVEKAQAAGLKWQLVPEAVKSILRHVRKWFIPSAKSPIERLRDLRKKAQYALNQDLLAELDDIIKTMEGGNAVEGT